MGSIKKKNYYKKKNEEIKKKELRKNNKEKRKEGRTCYGITSMGKYTEMLKDIMRREGIRTFRKGRKK